MVDKENEREENRLADDRKVPLASASGREEMSTSLKRNRMTANARLLRGNGPLGELAETYLGLWIVAQVFFCSQRRLNEQDGGVRTAMRHFWIPL